MAPLSETEIMTLKRLEVAIRKMDFKLLKSGAYKLHEKFHSGHKFEYTDLLKEIYSNISSSASIPKDIKDILIPTIEDILEAQSIVNDAKVEPSEDEKRVSSLTSLSYNAKAVNEVNGSEGGSVSTLASEFSEADKKINAYDAFGTQRAGTSQPEYKTDYTGNPIENVISQTNLETEMLNDTLGVQMDTIAPIQNEIMSSIGSGTAVSSVSQFETENSSEFSDSSFLQFSLGQENQGSQAEQTENQTEAEAETAQETEIEVEQNSASEDGPMPTPSFEITSKAQIEDNTEAMEQLALKEENKIDEMTEKRVDDIASSITSNIVQEANYKIEPVLNNTEIEPQSAVKESYHQETKSVSVFFSQDSSREKVKNITMYRELISKLRNEHISLDETLRLISEIRVQSDTNVMELRNVLNQFRYLDNKINLITNSSSSNLTSLLNEMEIPFSFIKSQEGVNLTLNPLFGLSNLFTCPSCSETYLDVESKLEPLILTCPKCKSPMYPTFYAVDGINVELNSNYYNYALQSLANSKIWLLIHPALGDVFTINMFKTALNISSSVEEIYILDKDINVRETYNSALSQSVAQGRKVFIDTQMNALEIFFKSIKQ